MRGGEGQRFAAGAAMAIAVAALVAHPIDPAAPIDQIAPVALCALAAALGAAVSCLAWPHRIGSALHCARCGYRHDQRGKLVVVCPECASPWRWIGWSTPGRPAGSTSAAAAGIALCAAALCAPLARDAASDAALWLAEPVHRPAASPVDPNPPTPRLVASSTATSATATRNTGAITIWAIRTP
jgi:hypothetical protein